MYQKNLKGYLSDLSQKKPSPGGGSAAALGLCVGIALIQKAINYSDKNIKPTLKIKSLNHLKRKIISYVDKDGEIFEKFIQSRGRKRTVYLRKSNALVVDLGKTAISVFFIARGVESGIKKSIISDFYTGLNFVKLVLLACSYNLEDNSKVLGKPDKNAGIFRKYAGKING
jgi:hypothetical protein